MVLFRSSSNELAVVFKEKKAKPRFLNLLSGISSFCSLTIVHILCGTGEEPELVPHLHPTQNFQVSNLVCLWNQSFQFLIFFFLFFMDVSLASRGRCLPWHDTPLQAKVQPDLGRENMSLVNPVGQRAQQNPWGAAEALAGALGGSTASPRKPICSPRSPKLFFFLFFWQHSVSSPHAVYFSS